MNKTIFSVVLILVLLVSALSASPPYVDVPPGSLKSTVTQAGYAWMPAGFGGPNAPYAVFRLGPLAAGKAYAVTLTYDAGTDIGYGHSWVDGDPAGKDYASLVGIGSGTGTRELKGKEDKFLFTVDPKSTSGLLYLVVRSSAPWNLSVGLADRPAGLTRNSQDRWGYYYVTDFDSDRTSPFLLTRSSGAPAAAAAPPSPSGYLELPPNATRPVQTAKSYPAMPNFFGGPDGHYAILHMGPLAAGRRYELTLSFDAGDDVGYSAAWVDGDPLGTEYWSFVGIGTGTGTRELKNKQQKYLFSIDAKSSSASMYLLVRSNRPWKLSVSLTDRLTLGLSRNSQDPWGYFYVDDFDESRHSPFVLTRSRP
jgi:hypothetical protein